MTPLTQAAVERIKPDPRKRMEISDAELPALRLVVQPSGSRSWAIRTKAGGRPAKITLGSAQALSLAEARDAARAKLAELAGRRRRPAAAPAPTPAPAPAPTPAPAPVANPLGKVAEAYLRDRA